jgi:signal transduction histidine kinase
MIARRRFALRWRIAALSSLAIAVLSIASVLIAFWIVRSSLVGSLQHSLREDVVNVAKGYGSSATATVPKGPTGGVIIQLYDFKGNLLIASSSVFGNSAIPPTVITATKSKEPQNWHGMLGNQEVQTALVAVPSFGVVAVISSTDVIRRALIRITRLLALTAFLLVVLSAVIGYLVAGSAMRPVSQLASLAARLDAEHLEPIVYRGPSDEVGQLSEVLNELITRLKEALDAQRTFLAETSHELRTPLTSLQGFLERALRRTDAGTRHDLLDARIAQSMSRLVADILQLSRGELVREVVPHLLDPAEDILRPVAEEFPGVKLKAHSGDLLLGDPERLRQLVRNLTANAVRIAGPEAVTLCLRHSEGAVILEVRDQGAGIPPEALPHIFDKFYKGAGGGAGLGLAIAKQIAEAHQGDIQVESTPGQGTVFRIRLPALGSDVEA